MPAINFNYLPSSLQAVLARMPSMSRNLFMQQYAGRLKRLADVGEQRVVRFPQRMEAMQRAVELPVEMPPSPVQEHAARIGQLFRAIPQYPVRAPLAIVGKLGEVTTKPIQAGAIAAAEAYGKMLEETRGKPLEYLKRNLLFPREAARAVREFPEERLRSLYETPSLMEFYEREGYVKPETVSPTRAYLKALPLALGAEVAKAAPDLPSLITMAATMGIAPRIFRALPASLQQKLVLGLTKDISPIGARRAAQIRLLPSKNLADRLLKSFDAEDLAVLSTKASLWEGPQRTHGSVIAALAKKSPEFRAYMVRMRVPAVAPEVVAPAVTAPRVPMEAPITVPSVVAPSVPPVTIPPVAVPPTAAPPTIAPPVPMVAAPEVAPAPEAPVAPVPPKLAAVPKAPKARIQVRPSTYRGKKGFLIAGRDKQGRQVRIFTESQDKADQIYDVIITHSAKEADATISNILLEKPTVPPAEVAAPKLPKAAKLAKVPSRQALKDRAEFIGKLQEARQTAPAQAEVSAEGIPQTVSFQVGKTTYTVVNSQEVIDAATKFAKKRLDTPARLPILGESAYMPYEWQTIGGKKIEIPREEVWGTQAQIPPAEAARLAEAAPAAPEVPTGEAGFAYVPGAEDFRELAERFKAQIAKINVPENPSLRSVAQAREAWRAGITKAGVYAEWSRDALKKAVPKEVDATLIDNYLEKPDQFRGQLSPQQLSIADELRRDFDEMHKLAEENGILEAYIENYTPHLYRDSEQRLRQALYPRGGRFGTKPFFTRERKIPTMDEAETLGLHPIRDIRLKMPVYKLALYRSLANKQLIETLKMMETEDGLPLVMSRPKRPDRLKLWNEDYVFINEPAFARYLYVGAAKGKPMLIKFPAKVHKSVAPALKDLVSPWTPLPKWRQAIFGLQGKVKRLIMYNPMIHGWNILSDVLDEVNFNPFAVHRVMRRGAQAWLQKDALIDYAVESGISMDTSYTVANELREGLLKHVAADKTGVLAGILKPVAAIEDWSDRFLWQKIVRDSQIGLFDYLAKSLAKKYPSWSRQEVGQASAWHVNTLLGTLPHTWMSRNFRDTTRFLLFARNWTVSNIDLVTRALFRRGLGYAALNKQQKVWLQKRNLKHLIKGFIALFVFANLGQVGIRKIRNMLITKGMLKGKPEPIQSTLENEAGHKWDIDTGAYDRQGRKIYIVMPLFRYIRDYLGYAIEPTKTIYNKMEPVLKNFAEAFLANYSVWQRKVIAPWGMPLSKRIYERAKYFSKGITPSAVYAHRPGEAVTPFERWIPFTGTWIRRGMRGGIYDYKLSKFMAEQRYKMNELDVKIDELLSQEKFGEALPLMQQRYVGAAGINRRYMEYLYPLAAKWKLVSGRDKARFLQSLPPEQQKEFLTQLLSQRAVLLDAEQKASKPK